MAIRRASGRRSSGPKRPTFWEGAAISQAVSTSTQVVSTVVSEATLENTPNPTLVRTRGIITCELTASGANSASSFITMGLIVVDDRALTAGIGSLQLPGTDTGSDWLWIGQWSPHVHDTGQPEATNLAGHQVIQVDSKAMRKIELNQALIFITQNVANVSTQTVLIRAQLRFLFKR